MNLHLNEDFKYIIEAISETKKINSAIIEKDYFVTIFLKKFVEKDNNIIFKGGTSLSKCYKIINRFSEDIDINYNFPVTQKMKKNLKNSVQEVADELDFEIKNLDEIRSRGDFNKYIINYGKSYVSDSLKKDIIVETAIQIESFPTEVKQAGTIIHDYLEENNRDDLIEMFDLKPFSIRVQSIERTFVDKIFAICDYHLSKKINEHSRHIYDLFKIKPIVYQHNTIEDLIQLIEQVRLVRNKNSFCLSAQQGVKIGDLLKEITEKEIYRDDFINITSQLLYEDVNYETCISVINEIQNLFE